MTAIAPLTPVLKPEVITLTKGPPPIDAARLELATASAFARHIADRITDGRYLAASWADAPPDVKAAWLRVVRAALESWETSR
jgi:DNA-binding SARP family transcriptional activator